MTDPRDTDKVEEAAGVYDVTLTDAEASRLAEWASRLVSQGEKLRKTSDMEQPSVEVRSANDRYDAFRCRFDLGGEDGSLADIDVGLKDNICVRGVPLTCGSAAVSFDPARNATVVDRLLSEGATIRGLTNMDAFAGYPTGETCAHGRTENPSAPGRVPGGSSSGSTAAVAGGLVDVALGSDTAGSVRIPASFCGVVGVKPTMGRVSRSGFVALSPSLDQLGVIAQSGDDAARTLDSIAGPAAEDPTTYAAEPMVLPTGEDTDPSFLADITIGIVTEAFENADEPVASTVRGIIESIPATAEKITVPDFHRAPVVVDLLSSAELASQLSDLWSLDAFGCEAGEITVSAFHHNVSFDELEADFADRVVAGCAASRGDEGRGYDAARTARHRITDSVRTCFESVDVLVTPTTPVTAPQFGDVTTTADVHRLIANTCPFNLSGHPAVSVPCGPVDGRPVGLQLVGPWRAEPLMFRIVSAIESVFEEK